MRERIRTYAQGASRFGRRVGSALLCVAVASAPANGAHAGEVELSFNAPKTLYFPEPFFPTMFRTRDLDGDGFVDVVVAGRDPDDRLITLKGVGDGTFVPLQTLLAEGFTDWLELADLDGDGREDIVTAWRGDDARVVVYRGLPTGQFEAPIILANVETGTMRDPQGVTVGDFDGDGDVDIAIASYIGHSVEVFSNERPAGQVALTFERTSRVRLSQFFGGYGFPRVLRCGDLDGDGDLDLVANELGGSRIAVIRNERGRFVRAVEYRAPLIGTERPGITAVDLCDIDGDGDLDAYAPSLVLNTTQKIVWFRNDGTGRFDARIPGESTLLGYIFAAKLADFDSDGDLDSVAGSALPGAMTVCRRTADGAFDFVVDRVFELGSLVRHVDAVDYDNDCDLDIIVVDGPGRFLQTRRNVTPQQNPPCGGVAARMSRQNGVPPDVVLSDERDVLKETRERRLPVARLDRNDDGIFDASDVAVWLAGISMRVAPFDTAAESASSSASSSLKLPVRTGGAQ